MMARPSTFLFYACGDSNKASSRVRVHWVVEELRKTRHHCEIFHVDSKFSLLRFAIKIPFYDVVVFQKTYSRWHVKLLQLAKCLGKKTVLDLDDAPSRTKNATTLGNVERMMNLASLVSVGSQNLFDYASEHQDRVALIPSSIKLSNYELKRHADGSGPACLGWIGNGRHYQQDLVEILVPVLHDLTQRHSLRLKIVGACGERELYDAFSKVRGLELDFIDQLDWSDAGAIAHATSDFDIGLYPLLKNDFNDFKCGFKALEYMASGIPVVSSNVAINASIVQHGQSGFMVEGNEQWQDAIERLVESPGLRKAMGQAGREIVKQRFDVKDAANLLANLVQSPIGE